MINLNVINKDCIQIFGDVNGFAKKRENIGEMAGSYGFNISFIKDGKLNKISNSPKDGTIRNIDRLKERIEKIYNS